MLGTRNSTVPPAPTRSSAIRRLVKVLPVPQAITSWPRSCSASPARTSSSLLLVPPQRLLAGRDDDLRRRPGELAPVDGRVGEVADVDPLGHPIGQRLLSVGRPGGSGVKHDPPGEAGMRGGADE